MLIRNLPSATLFDTYLTVLTSQAGILQMKRNSSIIYSGIRSDFVGILLEKQLNSAQSSNAHFTEVRFASFISGGFTIIAVINPPERKLAKHTSVHWLQCIGLQQFEIFQG